MTHNVWASPWTMRVIDRVGKSISVSASFTVSNLNLDAAGISGTRAVGCAYDRVIIGRPGSQRVIKLPDGNFSFSKAQLSYAKITDLSASITFGMLEPES